VFMLKEKTKSNHLLYFRCKTNLKIE
jgi:hypothetical protein